MNMNEVKKLIALTNLPRYLAYEGSFTLYVNESKQRRDKAPAYMLIAPLEYCFGEHQIVYTWTRKPANWDIVAAQHEPISKRVLWPEEVKHIFYDSKEYGVVHTFYSRGKAPSRQTINLLKPSKQTKAKPVRGAIDSVKQIVTNNVFVKTPHNELWAFAQIEHNTSLTRCCYIGMKCFSGDKPAYDDVSINVGHSNTLTYSELSCLAAMASENDVREMLMAPFITCSKGMMHVMSSNGHAGLLISFKHEYSAELEHKGREFAPEQFDELLAYMHTFKVKHVTVETDGEALKFVAVSDNGSNYTLAAREASAGYFYSVPFKNFGIPANEFTTMQVPALKEGSSIGGNYSIGYLDFIYSKQLSNLCNDAGYKVKAQNTQANGMLQAWLQNSERIASLVLMPVGVTSTVSYWN